MTFPDSVIVEVTAEDIRCGQRSNCENCPIALAVCRCFPSHTISVDSYGAVVDRYDGLAEYVFPEEAGKFIQMFDTRKPVSPFTFTITRMP